MEPKTSFLRALAAMIAGAVVGGNLSMGLLVLTAGPPAPGERLQIWVVMLVYWLVGMAVFAAIPFILLHFSNLRQWYAMTAMGVMTMVALSLFFFKGIGEIGGFAALAIIGGIVGWVVWRVAYPQGSTKDNT